MNGSVMNGLPRQVPRQISSRGGIRTLDLTIMNRDQAPLAYITEAKLRGKNGLTLVSLNRSKHPNNCRNSHDISHDTFYSHTGVAVSRGGIA